jgi:hypothetical protein
MPQSTADPSPLKVMHRPACPQCKAAMTLTRVEPTVPGIVNRTFACKCGHTETLLVQYR